MNNQTNIIPKINPTDISKIIEDYIYNEKYRIIHNIKDSFEQQVLNPYIKISFTKYKEDRLTIFLTVSYCDGRADQTTADTIRTRIIHKQPINPNFIKDTDIENDTINALQVLIRQSRLGSCSIQCIKESSNGTIPDKLTDFTDLRIDDVYVYTFIMNFDTIPQKI